MKNVKTHNKYPKDIIIFIQQELLPRINFGLSETDDMRHTLSLPLVCHLHACLMSKMCIQRAVDTETLLCRQQMACIRMTVYQHLSNGGASTVERRGRVWGRMAEVQLLGSVGMKFPMRPQKKEEGTDTGN